MGDCSLYLGFYIVEDTFLHVDELLLVLNIILFKGLICGIDLLFYIRVSRILCVNKSLDLTKVWFQTIFYDVKWNQVLLL